MLHKFAVWVGEGFLKVWGSSFCGLSSITPLVLIVCAETVVVETFDKISFTSSGLSRYWSKTKREIHLSECFFFVSSAIIFYQVNQF